MPVPYKVLARTYRPTHFDDLIGQEILVQTLTYAIEHNRIAHAFMLHGIRGVGKTTTARIIARALQCIHKDGSNTKPTSSPCGICNHCMSIAEDRHPDVIEMDAASKTGVNDIRDLIEQLPYLPSMGRCKVYIIDEIHMLSQSAFNALLKTLEEPPSHIYFIFATTEIQKVPVTILSRCQRFDLKRLSVQRLVEHLTRICKKENIEAETEALKRIAKLSEGSVRDSLSLLDQAISLALSEINAQSKPSIITSRIIQDMIKATEPDEIVALLGHIIKAEIKEALNMFDVLYYKGADPIIMIQMLIDLVHLITRLHHAKESNVYDDHIMSEEAYDLCFTWSQQLNMIDLSLLWQFLSQGLIDIKTAFSMKMAAEMVIMRIAYSRSLSCGKEEEDNNASSLKFSPTRQPSSRVEEKTFLFADMVSWFKERREMRLYYHLYEDVGLISLTPGSLELFPYAELAPSILRQISSCLTEWTGMSWNVILNSEKKSELCLRAQEKEKDTLLKKEMTEDPNIQEILKTFPGASVTNIKKE